MMKINSGIRILLLAIQHLYVVEMKVPQNASLREFIVKNFLEWHVILKYTRSDLHESKKQKSLKVALYYYQAGT